MNNFEVRDDVTIIFINSKKYGIKEAFISTSSLPKVNSFPYTWYLQKMSNAFYVVGSLPPMGRKTPEISLHRFITDAPKGMVVDHINRNTFDNTDSNLRIVTIAENLQNRSMQKNNTSGYRGVSWHKQERKWIARIRYGGKQHHIGLFSNIEDANQAAVEARMRHMPFSNEQI